MAGYKQHQLLKSVHFALFQLSSPWISCLPFLLLFLLLLRQQLVAFKISSESVKNVSNIPVGSCLMNSSAQLGKALELLGTHFGISPWNYWDSWKVALKLLLASVQDIWKVFTIVKTHCDLNKPCFCLLFILKAAWMIHFSIWFYSFSACTVCWPDWQLILNSSLQNFFMFFKTDHFLDIVGRSWNEWFIHFKKGL